MIIMTALLLSLFIVCVLALAWKDFIGPRKQRALKRQERREARQRGEIRARVWMNLWKLFHTPRLTDQRMLNPLIDERD